MAKAKDSQTSTDQTTDLEKESLEDVIDAEVIEDTSAEDQTTQDAETVPEVDPAEEEEDTSEESTDAEDAAADHSTEAEEGPEVSAEEQVVLDEPTAAATTQAPKKSSGFMPLLAGGVLAAGVGFGLSQYLGPFSNQVDPALVSLQETVAEQASAIESLSSAQATLGQSQTAIGDTATTLGGSVDGLTASLASLNARIDDMSGALAGIDGRITELEKRPITQGLPSSAIDAYERELEELKASVAAQRAEASAMEENAKQTAQQALARAALTRVLSALDSGAPFRAALIDLSTATGEPAPVALDALADSGAPSLASLQSAFPDAARRALAASRQEVTEDENRLLSFFQTQLGARSVTAKEGDDPDAVLSRAEAALRNGNLTDALAEIEALPEVAKAELTDWLSQATARQAALSAGNALTQNLNSN